MSISLRGGRLDPAIFSLPVILRAMTLVLSCGDIGHCTNSHHRQTQRDGRKRDTYRLLRNLAVENYPNAKVSQLRRSSSARPRSESGRSCPSNPHQLLQISKSPQRNKCTSTDNQRVVSSGAATLPTRALSCVDAP
ncbi:hypothetical protein BDV95DRAFT_77639 [Massariosphaeria phaeospora]|uniref:Uncharacterized protein n=1 Tax=Massariosphaeria phaeospora TaxID=100035 RepID=A0A7C8MD25_9PLEO|nr:hypothetical protein BDV95DRAFT_77639 [Massariosphaeria phaeospora]